jgi:hypothetical protein
MDEKYLRIRVCAEEICKLNLENTKIAQALTIEAASFLEKSFREIAGKLTAEVKPLSLDVESGIYLAVKSLFVFIDKGGRVDCPLKSDEAQAEGFTDI